MHICRHVAWFRSAPAEHCCASEPDVQDTAHTAVYHFKESNVVFQLSLECDVAAAQHRQLISSVVHRSPSNPRRSCCPVFQGLCYHPESGMSEVKQLQEPKAGSGERLSGEVHDTATMRVKSTLLQVCLYHVAVLKTAEATIELGLPGVP